MTTWAMEEFAGAKLGDQRLTQRLIKLATRFADYVDASIMLSFQRRGSEELVTMGLAGS